MSSLADQAREAMLAALTETESTDSNVDLFKEILDTPAQTFVTETDATTGNQFWSYLKVSDFSGTLTEATVFPSNTLYPATDLFPGS